MLPHGPCGGIDVDGGGGGRAGPLAEQIHPSVGEPVCEALLPDGALDASRKVLYDYGNMSSATVLFVLEEVLRNHAPQPGDLGLMTSFGAGFSAFAGLVEFM